MDRRSALKSMIALAVAPAIVKINMIMPVKAIVKPDEFNFTISGIQRGDRVYVAPADDIENPVIYVFQQSDEIASREYVTANTVYTVDRELVVRVRNSGMRDGTAMWPFEANIIQRPRIDLYITRLEDKFII